MKINLAHIRERSTSGGFVDFAVFEAKSNDSNNDAALFQLTNAARNSGLKVDKSALAFMQNGQITFFGTPDLVKYLSNSGVPQWTHQIDV